MAHNCSPSIPEAEGEQGFKASLSYRARCCHKQMSGQIGVFRMEVICFSWGFKFRLLRNGNDLMDGAFCFV